MLRGALRARARLALESVLSGGVERVHCEGVLRRYFERAY